MGSPGDFFHFHALDRSATAPLLIKKSFSEDAAVISEPEVAKLDLTTTTTPPDDVTFIDPRDQSREEESDPSEDKEAQKEVQDFAEKEAHKEAQDVAEKEAQKEAQDVAESGPTGEDDGRCIHNGDEYDVDAEFFDGCDNFCSCHRPETGSKPEVVCNPIKCPSAFGLDIINPFCLEWDNHEGFKPEPPTCCPPQPVCLHDGTCHYEGQR